MTPFVASYSLYVLVGIGVCLATWPGLPLCAVCFLTLHSCTPWGFAGLSVNVSVSTFSSFGLGFSEPVFSHESTTNGLMSSSSIITGSSSKGSLLILGHLVFHPEAAADTAFSKAGSLMNLQIER